MRKRVRSVQGVIRSLTPARSLPRLRALVQRVRDALQPAPAKPADPRKVRFEELEPRLLMSVAPGADPVLFVPGFGGSFAADTSTAGVAEWFTTIGLDPGKLALEPLGNVYQSFAQTLENVGYSLNGAEAGKTPFYIATWDWRLPVAPTDGSADGVIHGVAAQFADNGGVNPSFESGVDYLGWWLDRAADDWFAAHGTTLQKVDIVTHSTGGLVARSYLESDAYGTGGLPLIDELVLSGVPSDGTSNTFNFLHNDFSDDPGTRIFGAIVNKGWNLLLGGTDIDAPQGPIRAGDFTFADIAADQRTFINRYVGALHSLLPDTSYLDTNNDGVFEAATPPYRNDFLIDLNGAANKDAFAARTNHVTVVYSAETETKQRVRQKLGPDASLGLGNEVLPFTDYFGHVPTASEVWFQDIKQPNGGDGTVADFSARPSWFDSANIAFKKVTAAESGAVVNHSGLMIDSFAQSKVLDALGVTGYTTYDIATTLANSPIKSLQVAIELGIINPADMLNEAGGDAGVLVDKLLGYGVDVAGGLVSDLAGILGLSDAFGGFVLGDAGEVTIIGTAGIDHLLIRDNAALGKTEVVSLNNTIATHVFSNPTTRLRIITGAGADTIRVASLDPFFNVPIVIEANDSITLPAAISVPDDFIVTAGHTVTVADGANLTAGGDINLTANASFDLNLLALTPVYKELNATGAVTIGAATLSAQNVFLSATSTTTQFSKFQIFSGGLVGLLAGQTAAQSNGDANLTFSFVAPASGRHTITRSRGSWLADGFEAGQTIKVVGSDNNDDEYTIDTLSATVLTLVDDDVLSAESNAEFVVVKQVITSILPEDVPLIATDENGNRRPSVGVITAQGLDNLLLQQLAGSGILGVFDSLIPADAVIARATSTVTLASGARVNAVQNVSVDSNAVSNITISNPALVLGVTYADSQARAHSLIQSGASINAGGAVSINALVSNDLDITTSSDAGIAGTLLNLAFKVRAPSLNFSYGTAVSDSVAAIDAGAVVSGGSVALKSANSNKFSVAAKSVVGLGGAVGAAAGVALSETDSHSDARIDGSATATGGSVTVDAQAINLANTVDASAKVAQSPLSKAKDKIQGFASGKLSAISKPDASAGAGTFDIAAAVAYADSSNVATARVGNAASVAATGSVSVTSRAEDNYKSLALGKSTAKAQFAIGGAVAISTHDNHADAFIGDNAVVSAGAAINVQAVAIIPNQILVDDDFNAIKNFEFPTLTFDTSGALALYDSLDTDAIRISQAIDVLSRLTPYISTNLGIPDKVATSYVAAGAEAAKKKGGGSSFAASGAVDLITVDNMARAWIGLGARVTSRNSSLNIEADASIETVNIAGIPGIKNVVLPATKSDGSSVGGTYDGQTHDNVAKAWIADGAVASATGALTVRADVHNLMVNVTESGGKAKEFALNGAGGVNDLENKSLAWIEDTATATGGSVLVKATHDILAVTVTGTIVSSNNVGVGASFSWNKLDNETRAFIGNVTTWNPAATTGASLTFRDNGAAADSIARSSGSWFADGFREGQLIDIAGASGGNNGSFRIASISVDGRTLTLAPGAVLQNETRSGVTATIAGSVTSAGAVTLDASSKEKLFAVGIAAASVTSASPSASTDVSASEGVKSDPGTSAKQSSGLGLSGDVALNQVNDITQAYASGRIVINAGGNLALNANNEALMVTVSGAAAMNFSKGSSSVALAGSLAWNDLDRNVKAYTQGVTVNALDVTLAAHNNDRLITVAAGGAGTKPGGTAAIAGSVDLNEIKTDVQAWLGTGTVLVASGNVGVAAEQDLLLVGVAGGFSVSGKAGIGAAVDVGLIDTKAHAWIGQNTNINATGDIKLAADADQNLISIAASLGVGTKNLGLSGAAAAQVIKSDVQAFIADSPNVAQRARVGTGRNLLIDANDDLFLVAIGGAAAFGKSAGIGAAVGFGEINRTVRGYIGDNALVDAKGTGAAIANGAGTLTGNGILIGANAHDSLYLFGAGGAGSNTVAFEASLVLQIMHSTVDAHIGASALVNTGNANAGASTSQSVILRAQHDVSEVDVAGAIAGSAKVGIGAAADVELIDKTVKAYIGQGATVNAQGDIRINATSSESMFNVAAGIGASGKVGLAGSAVVMTLDTVTQAYIAANAIVSAEGSVVVAADSTADLHTIAGAVGIGGNVGFGASASVLIKDDTTEAFVGQDAQVSARGNRSGISVVTGLGSNDSFTSSAQRGLSVTATSKETLLAIAVGAAGAGSAGIAGSAVSNTLTERTYAYLDDGAKINAANGGANLDQMVNVFAGDVTDITSAAGGAAFGGSAGIGAGADVGVISKDTQAHVDARARVNANGNVRVQAWSDEDILSIQFMLTSMT